MLKRVVLSSFKLPNVKNIHTSAALKLREIIVTKKDNKITEIEGKYIPSPREKFLLKMDEKSGRCFLCQLQLNIKHTDVLILSQFITPSGDLLKRRDIGICKAQYKLISNLVSMAQYAGLLPEGNSRLGPKKPYDYLNTYFDESTIKLKQKTVAEANKLHCLKLGPIEKLRVRPELGVGHYKSI